MNQSGLGGASAAVLAERLSAICSELLIFLLACTATMLNRSDACPDTTLMNLAFRYGTHPGEAQAGAIPRVREVYGIWSMTRDEKERTLRVEYDGSRLSEEVVAGLLRSAGIDLREKLAP